ncbi:hypothetical protein ACROSR_19575 [Roseovarius tibetensis]|uniref:hypothetical protein n=1 Tax=Roseovarius tibetensis TaxID=2685897 RepID=UPI003D7FCDF7
MKFTTTAAAAGIAFMMAGGVSAATLTNAGTTCSVSDFTIGSVDASQCEGAFSGNDSNTDLNGIFGISGWMEIVKVDAPDTSDSGNGVALTVNGNGGTSGTWSVDSWGGFTTVMGVLKGGPTFSAYLLDTNEGLGGD